MTHPRRPAAGRRPAASRGRAGRTPRPVVAPEDAAPVAPTRSGNPLTGRAALLGLVVCTLVFSAALPAREYLQQRSEISRLEQDQAKARERVAALEAQKLQLQDPAHIAAEARRRLHMAMPGEVAYVLITPEPVPVEEDGSADSGPDGPWWGQVWGSVESADRPPAAEPEPAPAPVAPAPEPAVP